MANWKLGGRKDGQKIPLTLQEEYLYEYNNSHIIITVSISVQFRYQIDTSEIGLENDLGSGIKEEYFRYLQIWNITN